MIESPLIDELVTKVQAENKRQTTQANVLAVLEARFGSVPADIASALRTVDDADRLNDLLRRAATAHGIDDFRRLLH